MTSHDARAPNFTCRTLISLIFGLVVGSYMAQLFIVSTTSKPKWMSYTRNLYDQFIYHNPHKIYADINDNDIPDEKIHEHKHLHQDTTVADKLFQEVRVLCWVLTTPRNRNRANSVRNTWGKRCNKLLFIGTTEDNELGIVGVNVTDGKSYLWGKTKAAFKHIYKYHMDDYDWFFKADDDTYAIMENMRYFLYPYSTDTPIYFGARYKPMIRQGYMSGGAGYILSKEALRRFVEIAIPNPEICKPTDTGDEDVQIGWCLQNVNVTAGDTRDSFGRGRFFPFKPQTHLTAKPNDWHWYWKYIYYKTDEGPDCCSDYAVTFHDIKSGDMFVLDFLVYHLRPYGIMNIPEELPKKLEIGATMPTPIELSTEISAEDV